MGSWGGSKATDMGPHMLLTCCVYGKDTATLSWHCLVPNIIDHFDQQVPGHHQYIQLLIRSKGRGLGFASWGGGSQATDMGSSQLFYCWEYGKNWEHSHSQFHSTGIWSSPLHSALFEIWGLRRGLGMVSWGGSKATDIGLICFSLVSIRWGYGNTLLCQCLVSNMDRFPQIRYLIITAFGIVWDIWG